MKLRDTLELLLLSAIWGASFLLISLVGTSGCNAAEISPPRRLDRSLLESTFSEDFTHFLASADGVVDGRPVWRTTFFGGDRTLAKIRQAGIGQHDPACRV